jgi:hypothetical protein
MNSFLRDSPLPALPVAFSTRLKKGQMECRARGGDYVAQAPVSHRERRHDSGQDH